MRPLVLIALAALPAHADAGASGPEVYLVSTHFIAAEPGARMFVLLGPTAAADARWTELQQGSPRGTRLAPSAARGIVEVTLVGAAGARHVTSSNHLLVQPRKRAVPQEAVEVDTDLRDDFQVAIAGDQADARFHPLGTSRLPDAAERQWVVRHGHDVDSRIIVGPVPGTSLTSYIVEAPRCGANPATLVRNKDELVGTFAAISVLGGLTTHGHDYVLVADGTRVRAQPY